jgi:serine/threonine-protein kinase
MEEKIIEFLPPKYFRFIKDIGQGGTGKTVLLEDEIISESFICKKYSPFNPELGDTFFFAFC